MLMLLMIKTKKKKFLEMVPPNIFVVTNTFHPYVVLSTSVATVINLNNLNDIYNVTKQTKRWNNNNDICYDDNFPIEWMFLKKHTFIQQRQQHFVYTHIESFRVTQQQQQQKGIPLAGYWLILLYYI